MPMFFRSSTHFCPPPPDRMVASSRYLCAWFIVCCLGLILSSIPGRGASVAALEHGIGPGLTGSPIGPQARTYAVPEHAYFVAPDGVLSNSGTSPDAPWPVAKALRQAPSGATIVFRGGTYRVGEIRFNKNFTLQPYLNETPILKGSQVVTDWTPDGNVWRTPWVHHFTANQFDNLRRGDVDMVWIDNVMLSPVASREQVTAGMFFMDEGTNRLYIGTDPAGKTVEVTRYAYSFERITLNFGDGTGNADLTGVTIRGLTFTHYAGDGFWSRAAATVLEHNRFINNSQRGLLTYRSGHIIRNNEISANRIKGANFPNGHSMLFENNIVRGNSFEGLDNADNNIAVKFGFVDGAIIRNNLVEDNGGNGIWLDVGANNNSIVSNIVRNNSNAGIHFEISDNAIIAGNLLVGNNIGVLVSTSANGRIYNNTFVDNGEALHIREYYRDDSDAIQGPGNAANNLVVNNIFSNATVTEWPWALVTVRSGLCGDWNLVQTLDYNAYYRTNPEQPRDVIRWDNTPGSGTAKTACSDQSQTPYATLADFQAAEDFEQHGMELSGATNPLFADATAATYQLKADSPAIAAGQPLPEVVAAALNWKAGVPVDKGAFQSNAELIRRSPSSIYLPLVVR